MFGEEFAKLLEKKTAITHNCINLLSLLRHSPKEEKMTNYKLQEVFTKGSCILGV